MSWFGRTRAAVGDLPSHRSRLAGSPARIFSSWIERSDVIVGDRTMCRFKTRLLRCSSDTTERWAKT